jgi:predicted nucleic acid-binding protein
MRIYFETSAFMKILLGEPEADLARMAWDDADRIATSLITYTEARATVAAAARNGTLAPDEVTIVRSTLERMWGQCDVVDVTRAIASVAGDLAETWRLRSLDAIHLASVLEVADDRTVLQTWDRRLAFAARSIGLAVAGIEA